jgi:hypothetical protein
MCKYFQSKAMPIGGRNGYARTFHAETGYVFYRLRKGTTSIGGSFALAELTDPIMRINTARKLRMLRAGL